MVTTDLYIAPGSAVAGEHVHPDVAERFTIARGRTGFRLAGREEVLRVPVPRGVGLRPSSFHRRVRKLRRFLEPLRRDVLSEMVGDPETLLIDAASVLHPRQVS